MVGGLGYGDFNELATTGSSNYSVQLYRLAYDKYKIVFYLKYQVKDNLLTILIKMSSHIHSHLTLNFKSI